MMINNPLTEQDFEKVPRSVTGDNYRDYYWIEKGKVQSAKLGLMDDIIEADGDDYYISKKDAHILVRKWLDIGEDKGDR
jgi:hypothetical protein